MNVSEMSQYVENVIRLKDELIRDHFWDVNIMYFDVIYVYYTREHENSIEVVDFFRLSESCVRFCFQFQRKRVIRVRANYVRMHMIHKFV